MSFQLRWVPAASATLDGLYQAAARAAAARTDAPAGSRGAGVKASKQEGLFKQVDKAIRLLQEDPHHPGLQTHEFSAITNPLDPKGKVFEAYAQNRTPGAYRIFWCYGPDKGEITILAITPHP